MPLDQGVYRLRYCPDGKPPGLGGVIAVGQDLDAPVRALPDIPEITGLKEWRVSRVSDPDPSSGENQYLITSPEFPSVLGGWGCIKDEPGEDVLFATVARKWNIEPQDDPSVHVISVPTKVVGAIWVVVVQGDHLAIQSFPVIPGAFPLPAWQFVEHPEQ
ncbi:hypothetical protein MD484_g753, partial [Candolleomyces efflorescens]